MLAINQNVIQLRNMNLTNISNEQGADLIAAEAMGWQARKDGGAVRAPAQCREVMKLVAKYSGPIGVDTLTPHLLKAWNRGFLACNDEIAANGLANMVAA